MRKLTQKRGRCEVTDSKKVFFDTNPIIYYIEDEADFGKKMTKFMDDHAESAFVTSAVTVVEYLTGPFRNNDSEKETEFKEMISDYGFEVVSIDWEVAEEAARVRGKYQGFKTMDSLQLAAAKISGCDLFVSNDKQLKQYEDIEVLVVDEMMVPVDE